MSAVTSVAELDALPVGASVVTGSGFVYKRLESGKWWHPSAVSTDSAWLLDPEHSRQPIRMISTCLTCGRAMRPQRSSPADHPGMVKTGTAGECSTCTDVQVPRVRPVKPCRRCGYPTRKKLCADCHDTLTPAERKAWK